MLKTLGAQGYLIEWRVVSASDYGFPQRRIRVYIVASRKSEFVTHPESYVKAEGVLARALPVYKNVEKQVVIDLRSDPEVISSTFNVDASKSPFLNSGVYFDGLAYSYKTIPLFKGKKYVLGDVVLPESEIPDSYFVPSDKLVEWKKLKNAKTIKRVHKESGQEYQYSEGKMAFPDLLENPSRTILTGEGGTSPSRFKHIVKINGKFRRLTPQELENLNGFPLDWTATGLGDTEISDVRRAFFMGNALVVGLVEKVGLVLAEEMRKLTK
jgi:DNA (cytosine-5)-methyltransferase 1